MIKLRNENDKSNKTVFQKLKRLMTVTEKDVIEEKKKEKRVLKEAKPVSDSESFAMLDKPADTDILKEKKNKKPFLKIVDSDPHFDENEENISQEETTVENEDDVELIGKHERVVQDKVKSDSQKSKLERKKQICSDDDDEDDEDDEDDTDDDRDYNVDEEPEIIYSSERLQRDSERKPRKKKSLFKSIFKIGQALNAKPDEFMSDDEISSPQIDKSHKKHSDTYGKKNSEKTDSAIVGVTEAKENIYRDLSDDFLSVKGEIKAQPPIEDIDMSFVAVQKVNGNIFIEGNIEPMYTIETAPTSFNIEIGKLSPILMDAYEAYLEPEVLEAKKAEQAKKQAEVLDDEIITQATTAFDVSTDKEEESKKSDIDQNILEEKDYSVIEIEAEEKEEKAENLETVELFVDEKEKKRLEKKKAKEEKKRLKKAEKAEKKKRTVKERLFSDYSTAMDYGAFATVGEEEVQKIEDYETPQDARAVMVEINMNIRKLFFRTLIVAIVFVLDLAVTILQRFFPGALDGIIPNIDMVYCVTSLVLLSVGVGISAVTIKNGFVPLLGFKGNSDTAVAVATVATVVQCIVSFFDCDSFYHGSQSLYVILVLFALLLNSLGKMIMMLRIKDNFRFVAQDRRKYAATILNDKKNAEKMVRGTNAADPIIAYQRKTNFYKNFLKLSYAQDPSENMASKFSLLGLVCSVVVAIIHGIMFRSITGAFSAFAMVACLSVPVACLMAVNIPMKQLCKKALRSDAMIVGYPAVTQFVDTAAIMVDSKELYPRSTVKLVSLKPYVPSPILESCMLNAAAVLKVANTSLTYVFSEVIDKKDENLPYVDSVKFEENKGIVGWIGGERVLIGGRQLMQKYGIEMPSYEDERPFIEEQRNITYLANAGQLVAMIVTSYSPDDKIKKEIKRLEENGVSIIVRTADPNLTSKRIASDYGIHNGSVKILPNSLGKICKEAINERSRRARCYIGTRGKFYSLARAVSGCIKIKSNITLAVVIQVIGLVLGILFTTVVALLSGEQGMGAFELLCFMIFWAVAAVIVPLIQKP